MSSDVADLLARLSGGSVAPASAAPPGGSLPVLPPLRPLVSGAGMRRGATVTIGMGSPVGVGGPALPGREDQSWSEVPVTAGGCALLLALLAGPSQAGSWCALVGAPGVGLAAAAEAGVDLARLAMVPAPGRQWARAVGALLEGFDLVAVHPPAGLAAGECRALSGRARHHGAVLVSLGPWPGAHLRLAPVGSAWGGLEAGHGRLQTRRLLVRATGRGTAGGQARQAELWLPSPTAPVEAVPDETAERRFDRRVAG